MSKETFYEKFTSLNHKIDSMLQNYAVTNWIDSVARIMIFIDDEMKMYNAVKVIDELEKLNLKNSNVIIMLNT